VADGTFIDRFKAADHSKLTKQNLKDFEPGEPVHSDEVSKEPGGTKPLSEKTQDELKEDKIRERMAAGMKDENVQLSVTPIKKLATQPFRATSRLTRFIPSWAIRFPSNPEQMRKLGFDIPEMEGLKKLPLGALLASEGERNV